MSSNEQAPAPLAELTRLPDDRRTVELTATGPQWSARIGDLLAGSYGSG